MSLAPFNGWLARQTFALRVESPVVADVSALAKPLPVSKPLTLPLSGRDAIFSYVLQIDNKQVDCMSKDVRLSCDVPKLALEQSKSYKAELLREFNDTVITKVVTKEIQTLSAVTLTDSSIKANEVVYAKPTEIILTLDKKLAQVSAVLYRIDGEKRIEVQTSTAINDTGYTLKIAEPLARSADYELATVKVEAIDGSGLVEPHKLAFKTSGGPKVTGVNVGNSGVSTGTTVAVAFDQTLSETQNIDKFVTLTGGVKLIGAQGSQLLFNVASVPKCGDFSIKLTNDLQSNYDIAGHSSWSFASRTICHTLGTIGVSAEGRPIVAYYFGSGATSVLYTGAIHGSELSTKALMDRWVQELEAKAREIPSGITVVVVPAINPDGMARGSRTNANNVDLNRNFATADWKKDITTVSNTPFPGGGGESAMSEPETKAIANLAQRLRPKIILSYHSIGGLVAANQTGNSSALATTYARLSGYRNATGLSDSTFEYSVTGTADDWYAQAVGVPSLLIELGSHSYHQFERNQAAMWAMVRS